MPLHDLDAIGADALARIAAVRRQVVSLQQAGLVPVGFDQLLDELEAASMLFGAVIVDKCQVSGSPERGIRPCS
jgi:hypothetical protein